MTAFDQAWAIVKMPYHGTNAQNAAKIMQEGLVPAEYKSPGYDYSASFAAHHPDDAMDYAMMRIDGDPEGRGGPVVIRTPDDFPSIDDDGDYISYDETIPPELLEIVYRGRNLNTGEGFDDYKAALEAEMNEWLQNWEDDQDWEDDEP